MKPYFLFLQGLGQAKLSTNLVPREIIVQRLVRRKKPWAAAVVGILLLACAFNFFFRWSSWRNVQDDTSDGATTWADVKRAADELHRTSNSLVSEDEQQVVELERLDELGEEAVQKRIEKMKLE